MRKPLPCKHAAQSSDACGPAPAPRPHVPRRIALVNACPRTASGEAVRPGDATAPADLSPTPAAESATHFLLADLEDALRVYARHAARELGDDPDLACPDIVRFPCARPGSVNAAAVASCDAVMLGFPLCGETVPRTLEDLLRRLDGRLVPETRIYALVVTDSLDTSACSPAISAVRELCLANGALWQGGVMAGGAALLSRTERSPRMGMLRRRTSEAVDELIAHLRSGTDAGEIAVKQPIPRFAYRLLQTRAQESR